MSLSFLMIAAITLAGAIAAVSFRSLVHCALALSVSLAGVAGLYLILEAQFVGFAQVLIYIGAVAILIVFAILLTRGGLDIEGGVFSASRWVAGLASTALLLVLSTVVFSSRMLQGQTHEGGNPSAAFGSVRQIGDLLMTKYIITLQVMGLLLTAALIGAVIIARREKES